MSFFSLSYQLAPSRPTRVAEVRVSALYSTALMPAVEGLFALCLTHLATLNLVYRGFGGVTALLLWIYLSIGISILRLPARRSGRSVFCVG